jgi:superfamily II DNA or RNA helicase
LRQLRPYQVEGEQACRRAFRKGRKRLIYSAATGSGKTTVASSIIEKASAKAGAHILFLAHRKELISQCSKRLTEEGIPHGIIKAGIKPDHDQIVQVASKDTIVRRLKKYPENYFTVIIVDECHRTLGKTYLKILDYNDNAYVVGLTATPWRLDGKGLGDFYEEIIETCTMQDLIDWGYLVEPRIFTSFRIPNIKIASRGGDYKPEEMEKVYDKPTLIGDIFTHWNKHCSDRKTIIFATSINHSKHIAKIFQEHGINAAHIDGTTPEHERESILNNFEKGLIQVIVNVGILTEGYDCPLCSCIILARPTKSTNLYLQMAGRVLRPAEGKVDAIILDHSGCVSQHGFPQDEREYSLKGRVKNKKDPSKSFTTCKNCGAMYRKSVCPECGTKASIQDRIIAQVGGELKELSHSRKKAEEKKAYIWLIEQGKKNRKPPQWADKQFYDTFGHWPRFNNVGIKKEWNTQFVNGRVVATLINSRYTK